MPFTKSAQRVCKYLVHKPMDGNKKLNISDAEHDSAEAQLLPDSFDNDKDIKCDFYSVYLLRSIPKRNSTYIGSTPNPVRRLRQHNGDQKGGAYRTKVKEKRPWEMCLLVHGFPNKSIALKFEHAWQHVYVSRFSKKKHAEWKMTKQGNIGLNFKIKTLKLLLNSKHFCKFDLKVVIFDKDATLEIYNIWHKDIKRFSLNPIIDTLYTRDPDIFSNSEFNGKLKGLLDLSICSKDEFESSHFANENMKLITNFYNQEIRDNSVINQNTKTNHKNNERCVLCLTDVVSQKIVCYHSNCNFVSHFFCIYPKITIKNSACLLPKPTFDCFHCSNELDWFKLAKNLEN